MAKKNQLSVLIPDRSFDTSIGELTLKPFKFKHFKTALAIIEKYLKIVLGIGEVEKVSQEPVEQTLEATDPQEPVQQTLEAKVPVITTATIIESLLEKAEDDYTVLTDIAELLGLVCSKETSVLNELGYDEIFALLTEVVEQNMDFFGRIGKKINPQTEEPPSEEVNQSATTGESELPA